MHNFDHMHHLCLICGNTREEIEDGYVLQCHPPKGKAKIATRNKLRLINYRNDRFAEIKDPTNALKKYGIKTYLNYLEELK